MTNELGCIIFVSEFDFLSIYYGHFWFNTPGEDMTAATSYGFNSTTTALQPWFWY